MLDEIVINKKVAKNEINVQKQKNTFHFIYISDCSKWIHEIQFQRKIWFCSILFIGRFMFVTSLIKLFP